MTTYTTIAGSEIDVDSPITESLFTRLRDNPIAISEGSSGAPQIQTAAIATSAVTEAKLATDSVTAAKLATDSVTADKIAADAVTASEIAANAVGSSEIANGAVHQAELDTSTGSVSSSSANFVNFTLPGGQYGFWPQYKADTVYRRWTIQFRLSVANGSNSSPTAYTTVIGMDGSSDSAYRGTGYVQQRYVNSSPPYNIGNGDIAHFIYARIDNTTNDIVGTYAADAPPWAYNGPTDIRADFYDKQGKAWRFKRTFAKSDELTGDFEQDQIKLQDSITKRRLMKQAREGVVDWSELTEHIEPITHEIKNADMALIPQPMDTQEGISIVLLNPTSPLVDDLALLAEEKVDLSELLHNGYLSIDNESVDVAAPPGVKIVNAKWKDTGS